MALSYSHALLAELRQSNVPAASHAAATLLQATFRGHLQRKHLSDLRRHTVDGQRLWRGYRGRCRFRVLRRQRDIELREEYFNRQATIVQQCWRGHYVRKTVHSYVARKAYLQRVQQSSAEVKRLAEEDRLALLRGQSEAITRRRDSVARGFSENSHHLLSTTSRAGILKPTFEAVEVDAEPSTVESTLHATARGHTRTVLRATSPGHQTTPWVEPDPSRDLGSIRAGSPYDACDAERRLQRAVAKQLELFTHGREFKSAVKAGAPREASLRSSQGNYSDPRDPFSEVKGTRRFPLNLPAKGFNVSVHRQSVFEHTLQRPRGLLI